LGHEYETEDFRAHKRVGVGTDIYDGFGGGTIAITFAR
jgi:hypothetical protein